MAVFEKSPPELVARFLNVGPNAQQVAGGTHLDPASFHHAVAGVKRDRWRDSQAGHVPNRSMLAGRGGVNQGGIAGWYASPPPSPSSCASGT